MGILLIDKPVGIETEGGVFKITFRSGKEGLEFAMSRHILQRFVEYGRLSLIEAEAKATLAIIELHDSMRTGAIN